MKPLLIATIAGRYPKSRVGSACTTRTGSRGTDATVGALAGAAGAAATGAPVAAAGLLAAGAVAAGLLAGGADPGAHAAISAPTTSAHPPPANSRRNLIPVLRFSLT
jgi:hypothetical protein